MIVVKTVDKMAALVGATSRFDVGFVPTMGSVHKGHLSLIRKCQYDNLKTVVSIFVNPTQFNDPEDYKNYPREVEKDIELLRKEKVDYLFLPSKDEIYPKKDLKKYDLGEI